jgi:hypothetical protein
MSKARQLADLGNVYDDGALSNRNRIINGAMVIDQRNAGASVATSSGNNLYSLDRWQTIYSQTSKFTIQQNAGSVTPPAGFVNYLGVTSSSAYTVGSSESFVLRQPIEGNNVADLGWGTSDAKTVILSFKVRSSLTGTFGGALTNAAENRSYPFSYAISSANTWTSVSVTILGDTTGTWAATNTTGIKLFLGLGVGTTYSGTASAWAGTTYYSATGATSVVGTSGATLYITGVQLEVGDTATPFEHRSYGDELQRCQRYCFVTPTGQAYSWTALSGYCNSTSNALSFYQYPVRMRATPSVAASGNFQVADALSVYDITGHSITDATDYVARVDVSASGLTAGRVAAVRNKNDATAKITFDAEL